MVDPNNCGWAVHAFGHDFGGDVFETFSISDEAKANHRAGELVRAIADYRNVTVWRLHGIAHLVPEVRPVS